MTNKIVLVTGSNGLVGSEASKFFIQKGFQVIGIDNNLRKHFFGKDGDTSKIKKSLNTLPNYNHKNIDIRNKKKLFDIFKKNKSKIKLIIHTAGQPSHDWATKDINLDFEVNTIGTLNLLELLKNFCPKAVFIYTSTNKVYGDNPNKIKLKETSTRYNPSQKKYKKGFSEKLSIDDCVHSFFGSSKLAADIYVQEYGKNFKLKTASFRAGCITGPQHAGAELHGFLSYLVKSCIKKRTYKLIGYKGKQVRDNIHSYDLIQSFWNFYKSPRIGEVYNIGGGIKSNCSILEAIKYVEQKIGKKIKLKKINKPRVGDHIWYISNISKFKKHYPNYNQKYNTKKILDELINYELKNDDT